jgi:predicted lipoprotein with Yx(FWY)xxD motif
MKKISVLLVVGLLALAGCGGDDGSEASKDSPAKQDAAATKKGDAAPKREDAARSAKGTTITLGDSEFGSMLFDSKKQAIYIFENDSEGKTVCYGECAEAWPPVFTKGKPRAGDGVKQSLLGTVKRRDGKLQVSYAGKPLYFYSHEGPGEVRCHNVDLNGGLWWVVGPDGGRRA